MHNIKKNLLISKVLGTIENDDRLLHHLTWMISKSVIKSIKQHFASNQIVAGELLKTIPKQFSPLSPSDGSETKPGFTGQGHVMSMSISCHVMHVMSVHVMSCHVRGFQAGKSMRCHVMSFPAMTCHAVNSTLQSSVQ